jgi:hypothetical protein
VVENITHREVNPVSILAAHDDDLVAGIAAHHHGVRRSRPAVNPIALRRCVFGQVDLALEDIQLAHGSVS